MNRNFDADSLAYSSHGLNDRHEARRRERDLPLVAKRANAFALREGPCVGDFVIMPDGSKLRFTYDWGAEIQTTHPRLNGDQSFCLSEDGHASFSGSLWEALPKDKLTLTDHREYGWFWDFSNNEVRAHNAVRFRCLCRVYKYTA